jgi:putative ABC transport system permease protein
MDGLLQDLRFGFRMLVRSPGFTLISVLTLALGIGANSALFSVVHAVLLRSLPIPEANRYVVLYEANLVRGFTRGTVAPPNYLAWKARQTVFEDIAAYTERNVTLTGFETPELLEGARVSANVFQILRATPVLGRGFVTEEDRPESGHVAILSHTLWRRRFNARADILGQILVLDNHPYTIVGVMPVEFQFPKRTTEIWMPAAMDPERGMDGMSGRILQTIARLKPETTLDQAHAEMNVIAKQLAQANPAFNANLSVNIVPVREIMVGGLRAILLALLGAVGCVLFIGCANVANLLLARATGAPASWRSGSRSGRADHG